MQKKETEVLQETSEYNTTMMTIKQLQADLIKAQSGENQDQQMIEELTKEKEEAKKVIEEIATEHADKVEEITKEKEEEVAEAEADLEQVEEAMAEKEADPAVSAADMAATLKEAEELKREIAQLKQAQKEWQATMLKVQLESMETLAAKDKTISSLAAQRKTLWTSDIAECEKKAHEAGETLVTSCKVIDGEVWPMCGEAKRTKNGVKTPYVNPPASRPLEKLNEVDGLWKAYYQKERLIKLGEATGVNTKPVEAEPNWFEKQMIGSQRDALANSLAGCTWNFTNAFGGRRRTCSNVCETALS